MGDVMDEVLNVLLLCYDDAYKVCDNMYLVQSNGSNALVDSNNSIIEDFGKCTLVKIGDALAKKDECSRMYLVDSDLKRCSKSYVSIECIGNAIIVYGEVNYSSLGDDSKLAIMSNYVNYNFGLLDIHGNEILPCIYDYIRENEYYENGKDIKTVFVRLNNKSFRISIQRDGRKANMYDSIETYDKSIRFMSNSYTKRDSQINLKYHLVNGYTHYDKWYDSMMYPMWYKNFGIIEVSIGDKVGLIDTHGTELIKPYKWDKVMYTGIMQLCIVGLYSGEMYSEKLTFGLINFNEKEILPCKYSSISIETGLRYIYVTDNNNEYVLGNDGKLHSNINTAFQMFRLKDEYNNIKRSSHQDVILAYVYGKWVVVNQYLKTIDNIDISQFSQECWDRV